MPSVLEELAKFVGAGNLRLCLDCSLLASDLESEINELIDAMEDADWDMALHHLGLAEAIGKELVKKGCIEREFIDDFLSDVKDKYELCEILYKQSRMSKEDWGELWETELDDIVRGPLIRKASDLHALIVLKSCGRR